MVYLLSFLFFLLYNCYGDNMNGTDIIVNIKGMKDIDKINENTKYINIDVQEVGSDVIDYFLLNGMNYSYGDIISDRCGFIYASYDMFKIGESLIDSVIDSMPSNLSKLEMVRNIYVNLGKLLCMDINTMEDKNEMISFSKISTINNIWGALSSRRVNDVVISKIFMYVCARMGIKCELVSGSIKGGACCKVWTYDSFIVVDLFSDMYNIHGGFMTKYFDKYNDNKDMDRKINYIKDEYMDYYVDNVLKDMDYTKEDVLYEILSLTNKVINVGSIGPYELFKIYRDIFDKYVPNYDIGISNLFIDNGLDVKEHFIVFSYNDKYYSYNYNKGCFMEIEASVLSENIKSNRIGIYDDEDFDIRERSVIL